MDRFPKDEIIADDPGHEPGATGWSDIDAEHHARG
jgi:hypothetical protein